MKKVISVMMMSALLSWGGNQVNFVQGALTVKRDGQTLKAARGFLLKKGDLVETGRGGTAILELGGGALLKLKPLTRLSLDSLVEDNQPSQTTVRLQLGAVFSKILKQASQDSFVIRSSGVVVGVRGTEFFMAYGKKVAPDKNEDLWLCVNEGKVEVTSTAAQKSVVVNQGEGIVIPEGKDVTPPKAYEWTKSLNWNMEADKGQVEDKTGLDGMYKDLLDHDY